MGRYELNVRCKSKGTTDLEGDGTYATDLNKFYARFDCNDFEQEREDRLSLLSEKIKTGTRVKEYRYQRTKCFGI